MSFCTIRKASPSAIAVLPTPGRTDQHRVVLGPPRQDLDDASDFSVPANHGIEFSLLSAFDKIDSVLLQCLKTPSGLWSVTREDPRTARNALSTSSRSSPFISKMTSGAARGGDQGQQQVLGRDELVFHGGGFFRRLVEDAVQVLPDAGRGATRCGRQAAEFARPPSSAAGPGGLRSAAAAAVTIPSSSCSRLVSRCIVSIWGFPAWPASV